jgi:hypothetical protein
MFEQNWAELFNHTGFLKTVATTTRYSCNTTIVNASTVVPNENDSIPKIACWMKFDLEPRTPQEIRS